MPTVWHGCRMGQVSTEHALLLGVIVAAMLGMQLYTRRGVQAGIKAAADRLSPYAADTKGERAQAAGLRYESGERRNQVIGSGSVLARENAFIAETELTRRVTARQAGAGQILTTTQTAETSKTTGASAQGGRGVSQYSEVVVETSP